MTSNAFQYKRNKLYCEDVPLAKIAEKVGTPFYVYSQQMIEDQFRSFDSAFSSISHLTCYAVKANSNLALLNLLHRLGSGFDIVSGGELQRIIAAGGNAQKIVFSGVGKTVQEIDLGLKKQILQFNVESEAELQTIEARAKAAGVRAPLSFRVNPDVDPKTHPYISTGLLENKFGVSIDTAVELYKTAARSRYLDIVGVSFHIGSQITTVKPFIDALARVKKLILRLHKLGITFKHIDMGGGLGIIYDKETPPCAAEYSKAVLAELGDLNCKLLLEPGRVIVGNAGALATRVVLTKRNGRKNFVIVDAGMTELVRPSLYGSYHAIQPETLKPSTWVADVVGPICESTDFLARNRKMQVLRANDLLAVMSAGAYGFAQSSNYNTRPRAVEILVQGPRFKVIRKRETVEDMLQSEARAPFSRCNGRGKG